VLAEGDTLTLPDQLWTFESDGNPKPHLFPKTLTLLKQSILYQDTHMVVLNKPQGLAVQGGSGQTDHLDLYLEALGSSASPLRLTHRLDQDTSGVMLLAKTLQSAQMLTKAFQEHLVRKTYLAILVGIPPKRQGTIRAPMGKQRGVLKERMSTKADETQPAVTEYEVLHIKEGFSLVALRPLTGRTHQLRVHCAEVLKCPILGDFKYGGRQAQPFERRLNLKLHAWKIQVDPSVGVDPQTFEAPLCEDFAEALEGLNLRLEKIL
jgi:23S rRNA pseudouridine955/2504/2580 synthase